LRAKTAQPEAQEEIQEASTSMTLASDVPQFTDKEEEKTKILEAEIAARLAAANREKDLMAQVNEGMSDDAIKNAERTNSILKDIEEKKIERDRINQDLSRTSIDENEKAILELKRNAIDVELAILDEKFSAIQGKTAEQETEDHEKRLAAEEILNQLKTEQRVGFREQKLAKDEEEREEDIELKQIRAEEDLIFLQEKLMTEQEAKDSVRQEELGKEATRRNSFLKNEAKFGKTYATLKAATETEIWKGTKNASNQLVALKNSENSKMKEIGKAASLVQIGIKTAEGALSAYASLAPIPFVGPTLGIAAAAALTAYGAEQASKVGSYAVGTDFVPNDMMAQIHAGEAIIPAKQNQFLQSGNLVLGSPDVINNANTENISNSENVINLNFEGATFIGDVGDNDEFINQIHDGIATAINEGRLPGFEDTTLAVTG